MLAQQLLNGLLLGATYCLVALGFTLVVGAMDRLNLSLGECAMVCAFVGALIMTSTELTFAGAFVAALLVGALLSVIVYVLSFRLVRPGYHTASILSTLGVGIMLTGLVIKIRGTNQMVVPSALPGVRFDLGFIQITGSQVAILVLSALLTLALYLFLERTVWGTAIRGVSDDPEMTQMLGVPVTKVIIMTFALSGALAGAAGLLSGVAYHSVGPRDGFALTLAALMIIVVGGLGSVKGAMVAAILMAMIEVFSVVYLGATYREIGLYVLVGLFLILRPQGLFGRNAGVLERV